MQCGLDGDGDGFAIALEGDRNKKKAMTISKVMLSIPEIKGL